jgi:hypothetical protein
VYPANEGWNLLLGLMLSLSNQGKPAEPEVLPPPRELRPPTVVKTIEVYYAPDPYWRMRLYAVDRYGHLRARVIYTPNGAFYLYNGEPYPHTPTKGIP